jgi:hypothetical protein
MSIIRDRRAAALVDRYRIERTTMMQYRVAAAVVDALALILTPQERARLAEPPVPPSTLPQRHTRMRPGHGCQRTATSCLPQHRNPTVWGRFHVPPGPPVHGDYVLKQPNRHKETFSRVANSPVPTNATARHWATAALRSAAALRFEAKRIRTLNNLRVNT